MADYTPSADEISAEQTKNPGLTTDAAIGNLMTANANKQIIKPVSSDTPGILDSGMANTMGTAIQAAQDANAKAIEQISAIQPFKSSVDLSKVQMPTISQTPSTNQMLSGNALTPEDISSQNLIEQRRKQLAEQETTKEEEIKQEFDQQRIDTEKTNTANLEYMKSLMAGRGALPATNSQTLQFINQITSDNQLAMNNILVNERKALNDAQVAFLSADYDLASKSIEVAQKARDRYIQLTEWQQEMDLKKQELQLKMLEFSTNLSFKADELNLSQMQFGLDQAKALADAGKSQLEIQATVQSMISKQKEDDEKTAATLAMSLVGLDGLSADTDTILQAAKEYNIDPNVLQAAITKRQADVKDDSYTFAKNELDIASKLPPNTIFTMSDGTVIKSVQKIEDKYSFQDVNGRVFVFNETTGELRDTGRTIPKQTEIPTGEIAKKGVYKFDTPEDIAALPISTLSKAIIGGYGTTKDLTPTDKSKVIAELYQVGYDPKSNILDKIEALATSWEKIPDKYKGLIQGRIPFSADVSPEVAEFESAKVILTRQLARLFDVGMLSDQDVKDYKQAMPSRTTQNKDVITKRIEGIKTSVGGREQGADLKSQVSAKGLDYDAMKKDGYTDEAIKQALGL